MPMIYDTIEKRACGLLRRAGPMSTVTLAANLWEKHGRQPQHFARSAGRLMHRLRRQGCVRQLCGFTGSMWDFVRMPNAHLEPRGGAA